MATKKSKAKPAVVVEPTVDAVVDVVVADEQIQESTDVTETVVSVEGDGVQPADEVEAVPATEEELALLEASDKGDEVPTAPVVEEELIVIEPCGLVIGQSVWLKSGSPALTVTNLVGQDVSVSWTGDDGEVLTAELTFSELNTEETAVKDPDAMPEWTAPAPQVEGDTHMLIEFTSTAGDDNTFVIALDEEVSVQRDGVVSKLPAREVVVGDILTYQAGEVTLEGQITLAVSCIPELDVDAVEETSLRQQYAHQLPADSLAAWSDATLELYHLKGVVPTKSPRGNWEEDIRRTTDLTGWSNSALQDWADGFVPAPKGVEDAVMWDGFYSRFKVPANYTHKAAVEYALTGTKPAMSPQGLLLEDTQRAAKALNAWTYVEVRSALLKEIPSDFTEEELCGQFKVLMDLPSSHSNNHILDNLAATGTESNVNNTLLKSKLNEFAAHMTKTGGKLSETTAGIGQVMLYRTIRQVMMRSPADFFEGWNILLDFINANYESLFTPARARKGWAAMTLSSGARGTFEDLLTLMIATRKVQGRKAQADLFNLEVILRHVTSEAERQNLFMFYTAE